ncbi:MAG TPA: 4-hydroxythreonine-4-phosphate dehydrogenase PdxA [Candidatus Dormibacteraeota bacterium]|nr:4-hydroxythreonine-4-phosphate dehydrogenase PdxA [Candidatus Dormibacteraeota bacterium]
MPPGRRPRLVVSAGDPAGIGPEVAVKALARPEVRAMADVAVAGDPAQLRDVARRLGLPPVASVEPAGDAGTVAAGQLSAAGGRAAVAAVRRAVELVVAGAYDGLVTGPINKEAMRLAGFPWPGHTELLAELAAVQDVRMLLVAEPLRVVHVTTHRSLRSAIDAATRDRVLRTIELGAEGVRRLGVAAPRVAVAGVNPHAGEGGLFGDEESREIAPAVAAARAAGIDASGPWPADTLFWRAARGDFDLVVAMYHDQGHIPVKLGGFDEGVNVTLGLPFPRASVDHGTAFDIAGRGIARWQSMAAAIRVGARLAAGEEGSS